MRIYQKVIAFLCALVFLLCAVPVSASAKSAKDTTDVAVSSAAYQWELKATVFVESLYKAQPTQWECGVPFAPLRTEPADSLLVRVVPQQFRYTIDTGTAKFNTAIEYDTDENRRAYSRVKHYIVGGKAYSYEYDAAGNISKITFPFATSGSVSPQGFAAHTTVLRHNPPCSLFPPPGGARYSVPDGSWVSYTYDSLNQLVGETHSDGSFKNYTYDARGNLLSKTDSPDGETTTTVSYTYGDSVWKDRLTAFDGAAVSYDEIGNPTQWHTGATMTWQHGRRLASYTADGTSVTYAYNADGVRTAKTVNGQTTTYTVVDGTLRRLTVGADTLQFVGGTGSPLSVKLKNGGKSN